MKKTYRKGFNFFRSYFDVCNELPDKERLEFLDALLNKQFLGIDPEHLEGLSKFAWISQIHSIDSQVKGYETKTGSTLSHPTVAPKQGGSQAPTVAPSVQVQVEVQEKGEVQVQVIAPTVIPSLEEFIEHAVSRKKNICKDDVTLKYYAWIDNDWSITRKGHKDPITNWKSTLTNTVKYLNEAYKQPTEPIEETMEERIIRINKEAKAQG